MRKIYLQRILFFILTVALTIGLSYVALHQVSKIEDKQGSKQMAIALVNEDEGAKFSDHEISFGDEFVKSIGKDHEHDWYVVSRGVAENGFEQNLYNMVIIIPNDFSEKAIAIDVDFPENVVLNYKINSSGHEDIRAEAEQMASEVLNDFNRRIIDVYFASVIGNLQEAQDHIKEIVEKEAQYTNTYNQNIHDPLSNYTNQFDTVSDYSQISKDRFHGLENILQGFEEQIHDEVQLNKSYAALLNDFSSLKKDHSQFMESFSKDLMNHRQALNEKTVQDMLDHLETINQVINNQFKKRSENDQYRSSIVYHANLIEQYFQDATKKVDFLEEYLRSTLDSNMKSRVEKELSGAFERSFEEEVYLSTIFKDLENYAHQDILKQIKHLPSLDVNDIKYSGLPQKTTTEIENVILATKKYVDRDYEHEDKKDQLISSEIRRLKAHLVEHGISMTDEVRIMDDIKSKQVFHLTIDDYYLKNFDVAELTLIMPDGQAIDYTNHYKRGKNIYPPIKGSGKFEVKLKLKLKSIDHEIDVFDLAQFRWELHRKGIVRKPNEPPITDEDDDPNEEQPEQPDEPDEKDHGQDESPIEDDGDVEEKVEKENEDLGDNSDEIDAPPHDENDDENDENDSESDDDNNDGEDDEDEDGDGEQDEDNGSGDQRPGRPKPKKVRIINDRISHQVMNPFIEEDLTQLLIHSTSQTISEYQKLLSLFESYYGFDLSSETFKEDLSHVRRLSELATKDSYYHLFNKKDIVGLLQDYIVSNITEEVTSLVREPIEHLYKDIYDYKQQVDLATSHSDTLEQHIIKTTDEARQLNDQVGELLNYMVKWRENSAKLVDHQTEILAADGNEQSMIVDLDREIQTVLSATESLSDQATDHLQTADDVYQTFDAIDEQARSIQESGFALINQAHDLSTKMTDKMLDDQEFADNFSEVMANSRMGNRQNEHLYHFLSNPVKTENAGTIVAGNTFTPYYLVLICAIVALFTAYVISISDQRRVNRDQFASEQTLIGQNIPTTLLTTFVGMIEGLIIGISSGYLLNMSQSNVILWTGIVTLIVLAMLLCSAYLLRQVKMVGMFILLVTLSIYLFFTETLGFGSDTVSFIKNIQSISPLQHVEKVLSDVLKNMSEEQSFILTFFTLALITLVGIVLNVVVWHRTNADKEMEESDVSDQAS